MITMIHTYRPMRCLQMLLLLQTDVTARVEMEIRMTALNETQINLLDQVWESVEFL